MEAFTDSSPAEEHHRDEGGLDEEGKDSLDGERRSEYVADEPRLVAEVGPELELKDDSCRDADGEVDTEYLHPELRGVFPEVHLADDVERLHNGHYHRQSEGQRDEDPVIAGSQGELRP